MGLRETVSIGTPLKSQRIERCEHGVHSNSCPNLSLFPLKCSSNWLCHSYVPVFVSHPDTFGHTLCPLFSRGSFKTNSSSLCFSLESTPVALSIFSLLPIPFSWHPKAQRAGLGPLLHSCLWVDGRSRAAQVAPELAAGRRMRKAGSARM